ncbi:MAG: hypothetical protein DRJ55_01605 [Thermoprotei archaeon]|nr:MAG: hypothetical protein DRJ55_01605 [Thermoprotei archaeon]HDJ97260.1 hypothetical protein [Thermofilum sp.]
MIRDIIKNNGTKVNILLNIPRAKTLRELARLSGVSLSTVQRYMSKLNRYGMLKFVPDDSYFGLIRLAVLFSYGKKVNVSYSQLPIGTMSIRNFVGVGRKLLLITAYLPRVFVKTYLAELFSIINSEILGIVHAKEYLAWKPEASVLNMYRSDKLKELRKKVYETLEKSKNPVNYRPNNKTPDSTDLKILTGKLAFGPYGKIGNQLAQLEKYFRESWNISKQTISYHYRSHVLKGWKYNTYHFYLPHERVPFSLLYLVGEEAPALARALMIIPHSLSAYVEEKSAAMFVQYPDTLQRYLYEVASTAKVEIPYGPFIMNLSLSRYIPPFWRFVEGKAKKWKWIWPKKNASLISKRLKTSAKFNGY